MGGQLKGVWRWATKNPVRINGRVAEAWRKRVDMVLTMVHNKAMLEIIKTDTFERWLRGLKDRTAIARINARIRRMSIGNLGDIKMLRDGVAEVRIDFGPGYRLYFIRRGPLVIVLLAGGDKRTQDADINRAIVLAKDWRD